jgi:hypothetical protein
MSESKFKELQQEICYKEPEQLVQEPDKICPTCIPNPNYTPPEWEKEENPYLNEKECEYQVRALINIDGDQYHDSDTEFRSLTSINKSPYDSNTLLKSYIRPAVRTILRYFGKLETDEIVCATPPQTQGQTCKGIHGLDYDRYLTFKEMTTDDPIPQSFQIFEVNQIIKTELPEITNVQALELVARVKDYTFFGSNKMLMVLIGIPAYRIDAIPEAPDLGSLSTETETVVIKPPEFMDAIQKFKGVMNSYKTFQSYFFREENGSIYFEETNEPFYIKFYAEERIEKFVSELNSLLNLNDFDLRGFANSGARSPNIAYEIEVSFDKSDPQKPFVVKNVRARKANCPYIECKKGLEKFIAYSKIDQTMMGYFSDIQNIKTELSSNVTPPWLDFIVSKTFPQLAVNYGSSEKFEDNSCLSINLQDSYDFILNETMDLFKAIEYQFNQNRCKTKEETQEERKKSIGDLFSGSEETQKKLKELNDAYSERIQDFNGFTDFEQFKRAIQGAPDQIISQFFQFFNPCSFASSLGIAIKCLSAGLTLDEMYYTIIKQMISSVGEEAIKIVMETLPANKQQQIEEEIQKQFKDMPAPWEPGWESGSLGAAVDRQARNESEQKEKRVKNTEEEVASLQKQIKKIEEKISKLSSSENRKIYYDNLKSTRERIQSDILQVQQQIDQLSNTIPGIETQIRLSNELVEIFEFDIEIKSDDPNYKNSTEYTSDIRILNEENSKLTQFQQTLVATRATIFNSRNNIIIPAEKQIKDLNKKISQENDIFADNEYNREIAKQQQELENQLEELKKKRNKNDKIAENLAEYENFSNLSEEDQQKYIDKQKEKVANVRTTPSDEITEGTLSKALGNVQKALTQAYIDEIMKTATISELQRAYENIPGAGLLAKLISNFKCGSDPLVYPPIESFLSTLTFDPCGTEKTRFSLPSIQEIPLSFNWIEVLGDAFYDGIKKLISNVLIALITKAVSILDTELCKLAGNLTRGAIDGGFEGVLDSLICPDPKTNDDKQKLNNALLSKGAGGRSQESYDDLAKLLSVSSTQREIKSAMVGRADSNFLSNISTMVKNVLPEFSDVFGNPQKTRQYFDVMGNILTPEQRRAVISDLDSPLGEFPVEASICLTKEERDLWDQERIAAFSDPEMGREFVNKQNEKLRSDLSDAVNLLLNGPEQALQDAINNAFNPKDPDCKNSNSVVPTFNDYPQNQRETISNAITGIFKNLEKAFIDDTIEGNFFNPFNPPGILVEILSDTKNLNLLSHNFINNNPIFRFLFPDGILLPQTVGIQMKEYIDNNKTEVNINEKIDLLYDNQKEDTIISFLTPVGMKELQIVRNFKSKIEIDEHSNADKIIINDEWNRIKFTNDNLLDVPIEYIPDTIDSPKKYKQASLGKMIESIWSDFQIEFQIEDHEMFLEGMNDDIYNKLAKKFTERQKGQISEGFLYGNMDTPILEDTDLVYVNPEPGSTEYTYEEEDKVLGRSLTNNPRVHFLDPQKYGGTYSKPNIYIAEANHKGWLNFSNIIVPNPTGCDPKNSNFLMLDTIVKQIDENKQKIQSHELLQYDPTCTVELPFDKISNSDTLATLEGIVRATIRVYLSDFLIRSYPIFSNVHLDIEKNYDNIVLNYITETIYKGLINEKALFSSTYEGYTYMLLFLEQVVQIVHRRVRDGKMQSNQEIEEVLEICNQAQERHPKIFQKDFKYIKNRLERETISNAEGGNEYGKYLQEIINYIQQGIAIIGSGGPDVLNFFEDIFFELSGLTIERARFAAKINSIYLVENDIKKLLKYIIKEEMDLYTKKMRDELEPRPWIYDIKKFFLGGSEIFYGKQNNSGIYDYEVPIGGGQSSIPFGEINHCPKTDMVHSLNQMEISDERYDELRRNGGFYLEKYVVVKNKEGTNTTFPSGIQNILEFKQSLNLNNTIFEEDSNISDYFGNAVLNEEGGYDGSIGIKFGVRMCYMPPERFGFSLSMNNKAREYRSFVQNPASFKTDSGVKTLDSSKYSFPICSYEQDILDIKMKDLINSNENLNQDIRCYIDKLIETKNFKHLVNNVLQINKISSLYLIYSYINFIPSLADKSERDNSSNDVSVSSSDLGKAFNDSKYAARSLFASYYKNNDRDPRNEEESSEDIVKVAQRKATNALSFINLGQYSWDIRRRIKRQNPFDKDGNECKNDFGKLFNKKGG